MGAGVRWRSKAPPEGPPGVPRDVSDLYDDSAGGWRGDASRGGCQGGEAYRGGGCRVLVEGGGRGRVVFCGGEARGGGEGTGVAKGTARGAGVNTIASRRLVYNSDVTVEATMIRGTTANAHD